jgi:hypothetical protein
MFNLTRNLSDSELKFIENYYQFYTDSLVTLEQCRKINLICTIIFSALGIVGHSLTIFVFAQKRFRKNSSNVYLLCLAINDGLYLITNFFEVSFFLLG